MIDSILEKIDIREHSINMLPVESYFEIGSVLGLNESSHVLDLCCGYGEMLRLFSKYFRSFGVGVDISKGFVEEGQRRLGESGLSDQVKLISGDARGWTEDGYDVACLVGEQRVFSGFSNTLSVLLEKVTQRGKVVIGTIYYLSQDVPQELIDFEGPGETEKEIFTIVKDQQCIITYIGRGTRSEWDRYISWSTRNHLKSYRAKTDQTGRDQQHEWMHRWHDMYIDYRMKHQGWATYVIEKI